MLFQYFIFPFILELLIGNKVHSRLVQKLNETKGTDGGTKQNIHISQVISGKVNVTSCFGQHVSYGENAEKYCVGPELDKNFKPVQHGLKNIDKREELRPRRAGETKTEAAEDNGEVIEGDELDETELTSVNTLIDSTTQVDTTVEPAATTTEDVACPSSCPAADNMVCGRCGHERYHTYLSACHLRLHSCKYPHHGVQLVGRYPCGQYGPINTEFNVMGDRIYLPLDQSLPVTGFN